MLVNKGSKNLRKIGGWNRGIADGMRFLFLVYVINDVDEQPLSFLSRSSRVRRCSLMEEFSYLGLPKQAVASQRIQPRSGANSLLIGILFLSFIRVIFKFPQIRRNPQ